MVVNNGQEKVDKQLSKKKAKKLPTYPRSIILTILYFKKEK